MPELEPRNELAWQVFNFCQSQMVVAGMGTPLGIAFDAIDRAMHWFRVPRRERRRVFDQVRQLGEMWGRMIAAEQRAALPKEQQKVEPGPDLPPMLTPVERIRIEDAAYRGDNGDAV